MGADAIGLVFYPPSPRNLAVEQAAKIVAALPAFVTVVGLFVDGQASQIHQVLQQVPIDCLQFHGDEPPEACRLYGKPYIKALRVQADTDIKAYAQRYFDAAGLLLDAYQANEKGGTGQAFDWTWIPKQCALPIILAGGLRVDNAKLAVTTVAPYALDVSSGVEIAKGVKDAVKIKAFLTAVNDADREKNDRKI
jgi:phosphoribosylanthranilate isomerase